MATRVINGYLYLIQMSDIMAMVNISPNIDEDRLNAQIKNAQDFDLRLFMGDAFYWNFINWFNPTTGVLKPDAPALISQLFNGGAYNDLSGNPIFYQGMAPALVYMAFARFVEFDPVQYTSTGPVIKHHDQSDPLRPSDISKIVSSFRSMSNAHTNNIEKFLYVHKTSFPLWRINERAKNSRQPGARIRGVDRTQFNRAGYGYRSGYDDINSVM